MGSMWHKVTESILMYFGGASAHTTVSCSFHVSSRDPAQVSCAQCSSPHFPYHEESCLSRWQEQSCLRGCEAAVSPGVEFSICASRALPLSTHTRLTRSSVRATGFAPRSPIFSPCCFTDQQNLKQMTWSFSASGSHL